MRELKSDILIVGGGLGGVAAALAAARMGRTVILTEETRWLGGQLTSQAVPPDEHPWIEETGATASYSLLRRKIRDYYRRNYPLLDDSAADVLLNPGMGFVSPLCHEPRVALAALEEMIAPHRANQTITVMTRFVPVAAETDGDVVNSVTLEGLDDGERIVITAPFIIDATEVGS